jgi:hypothetical protein
MSIVTFNTIFSGGAGDLQISFDTVPGVLHFSDLNPGSLQVDLPPGVTNYTVSGNASPGPGGNIHLDVTGAVLTPDSRDFGPGLILPITFPIVVI